MKGESYTILPTNTKVLRDPSSKVKLDLRHFEHPRGSFLATRALDFSARFWQAWDVAGRQRKFIDPNKDRQMLGSNLE